MNTNLRQTLTLWERSFTILRLFPFFIFPFPVTRSPIRFLFRVLVKVLWYTYLLYERDSVNLKKVISEIAML